MSLEVHCAVLERAKRSRTLEGVTNISCIGLTVDRNCATTSSAVRPRSATSLCIRLMNRMSGSCPTKRKIKRRQCARAKN